MGDEKEIVWKPGARFAYDERGKIRVIKGVIDLKGLIDGNDGALDDARNGKLVILVTPTANTVLYFQLFVVKLDAELDGRFRFVTPSLFIFVHEDDLGGVEYKTAQYYVARMPSPELWTSPPNVPTSLVFSPFNSVYPKDRYDWFMDKLKQFAIEREQFVKQVNEIKIDPTRDVHLRLHPIVSQSGMRIVQSSVGSHFYKLRYPNGISNVETNLLQPFASVFAPNTEFFENHQYVIPAAFAGRDVVLWKNQLITDAKQDMDAKYLQGDDLSFIQAALGSIWIIDFDTGKVNFEMYHQNPIDISMTRFFKGSDDYFDKSSAYRMLLPPMSQPIVVVEQTVPQRVAKEAVTSLTLFSRGDWLQGSTVSTVITKKIKKWLVLYREPEDFEDLSAPVVIAKEMDLAAQMIIRRVLEWNKTEIEKFRTEIEKFRATRLAQRMAEQLAKDLEAKREQDSPLTGAWGKYCTNDVEYLTRDPMVSFRNGVDIVAVIPPTPANARFCYLRHNLIKMMTDNTVYQWPRSDAADIMYHKLDPGFWVTHESLQHIQQVNPQISLFKLVPLGVQQVGTEALVISAMHGTSTMIYHLEPVKTRAQVQDDIKTLRAPPQPTQPPPPPPLPVLQVPAGLSAERQQMIRDMIERNRQAAMRALQLETPTPITDFNTTDFKTPLQGVGPGPSSTNMNVDQSWQAFATRLAVAHQEAKRPPPQPQPQQALRPAAAAAPAAPPLRPPLRPQPVFHMQLRPRSTAPTSSSGQASMDIDTDRSGGHMAARYFCPKLKLAPSLLK
jgi:hypothetical protein